MLQDKTKSDTVKCPVSGHALTSTLPRRISWTLSHYLAITTLLSFMVVGYKDCGICKENGGICNGSVVSQPYWEGSNLGAVLCMHV